ncbi:MAG: DUF2938 domain-containing protein [Pseudomonadota bacterium]|nr:DUF2938 domain-containing protein [Pseudomonadota bacterium]
MDITSEHIAGIVITGIGATLTLDVWSWLRRTLLGIAPPDYAMVGRWLLHMRHGQFRHEAIRHAPPMPAEGVTGWLAHYLTGMAFAGLLPGLWGWQWLAHPTPGPALLVGVGTVAAPFLLMQPGMGAGIAASRTPDPGKARRQSLLNHAVFGVGLYLGGWAGQALIQ